MFFEWHTVTYKDPELNEPSLHVWCMFFEILFPNPKVFQIQPPRKWKPCWRNRDVNILRKSRSCRWLLTRLNVLQKRPLGCLLFFSDKALLRSCNETVTIHHWLYRHQETVCSCRPVHERTKQCVRARAKQWAQQVHFHPRGRNLDWIWRSTVNCRNYTKIQ